MPPSGGIAGGGSDFTGSANGGSSNGNFGTPSGESILPTLRYIYCATS